MSSCEGTGQARKTAITQTNQIQLYTSFVPATLPVVVVQTQLYVAHIVFLQGPEPCFFLWLQ